MFSWCLWRPPDKFIFDFNSVHVCQCTMTQVIKYCDQKRGCVSLRAKSLNQYLVKLQKLDNTLKSGTHHVRRVMFWGGCASPSGMCTSLYLALFWWRLKISRAGENRNNYVCSETNTQHPFGCWTTSRGHSRELNGYQILGMIPPWSLWIVFGWYPLAFWVIEWFFPTERQLTPHPYHFSQLFVNSTPPP